jgi:hypothetical protein
MKNTRRYIKLFTEAADLIHLEPNIPLGHDDCEPIEDIIKAQRMTNMKNQTDPNVRQNPKAMIPPELMRR